MKNLVTWAFIGSYVFTLLGVFALLDGFEHATKLMVLGFLCYATFLIKAILEISSSKNEGVNKFSWIMGLVFIGSFIGIAYLLAGRKRFVQHA